MENTLMPVYPRAPMSLRTALNCGALGDLLDDAIGRDLLVERMDIFARQPVTNQREAG